MKRWVCSSLLNDLEGMNECCIKMIEGERSEDSGYSDIQENPT
jgi:hypothetical protein